MIPVSYFRSLSLMMVSFKCQKFAKKSFSKETYFGRGSEGEGQKHENIQENVTFWCNFHFNWVVGLYYLSNEAVTEVDKSGMLHTHIGSEGQNFQFNAFCKQHGSPLHIETAVPFFLVTHLIDCKIGSNTMASKSKLLMINGLYPWWLVKDLVCPTSAPAYLHLSKE